MQRVVILGGSGFIGRWLTAALLTRAHEVVVVDRDRPADVRAHWIAADARDPEALGKIFRPHDVVVHLIHSSIPAESVDNPGVELAENVEPYARLLAGLGEVPIKLLIYSSTGGQIYGEPEAVPIPESHPLRPLSEYGRAKAAMEELTRAFGSARGVPWLIVRIANPYGPHQERTNRHGVVPHLFRAILHGRPFTLYGGGQTVRDYLYIEDVAEAIVRLIGAGARDRAVNIGSGRGIALAELIALAERVSGGKVRLIEAPRRAFDVTVNVLAISLLGTLTGFTPAVIIEDGLARTWEHMKKNEET
jgi:UDP-glucose 4-epimerase